MSETLFDVPAPRHCATGCWYCNEPDPALAGQLAAMEAASAWYEQAQDWLKAQPPGRIITSEDVTDAVGKPNPTKVNANNAVGAFMQAQKRLGRIVQHGYGTARNRESHGSILRMWQIVGNGGNE